MLPYLMKSARNIYIAVKTTSPRESNTSLIDSWCIDWNTASSTGIEATHPESNTALFLCIDSFLLKITILVINSTANNHRNGSTNNGRGNDSGLVVIKNTGPAINKAPSCRYCVKFCFRDFNCTVKSIQQYNPVQPYTKFCIQIGKAPLWTRCSVNL